MSEKTEKATPKKVKDSREKGQVGQSQDISVLLPLAVILEVIIVTMDTTMSKLTAMLTSPFSVLNEPFEYAVEAVAIHSLTVLIVLALLSSGLIIVFKSVSKFIQFGLVFAPKALAIDMNRLNPFAQLKQLFSMKKLFDLFNNIIKTVFIFAVVYIGVKDGVQSMMNIPYASELSSSWIIILEIFKQVVHMSFGILLVIAVVDFALQKYFYLKGLKMSKDDVKKEFKEMEGDPFVKSMRKSIGQEIMEGGEPVNNQGKKADVVVVNPTHFAVALIFEPNEKPLPYILNKGADDDAKTIIQNARQNKIPIVRFVWLARTLYKVKQGAFIPRNTLKHVARIYQALQQLDDELPDQTLLEIPDVENN